MLLIWMFNTLNINGRRLQSVVDSVPDFDIVVRNFNASHTIRLIFSSNLIYQPGYDTRSIFKRSLTGLNSEFSFS